MFLSTFPNQYLAKVQVKVLGWKVLGWKVLGWKELGWKVLGWKVLGWKVLVWKVLGWKVFGWKHLRNKYYVLYPVLLVNYERLIITKSTFGF